LTIYWNPHAGYGVWGTRFLTFRCESVARTARRAVAPAADLQVDAAMMLRGGLAEFLDDEVFVIGDGLFGDAEGAGDLLVGPGSDEEEFGAFEAFPFTALLPANDEIAKNRFEGE